MNTPQDWVMIPKAEYLTLLRQSKVGAQIEADEHHAACEGWRNAMVVVVSILKQRGATNLADEMRELRDLK